MKKFREIFRQFRVEIIAFLAIVLGLFLLVEQFNIRQTIWNAATNSISALRALFTGGLEWVFTYLTNFTLSDLVGWFLIISAILFVTWRIRHRYLRSKRFRASKCPRCDSSLRRIHRTSIDRFIGATLLPRSRRFRCSDKECGWTGLLYSGHRKRSKDHPQKSSKI